MRRIAVEEAFVTEEIAREWDRALASRFVEPGFRLLGDTILGDSPAARGVHAQLVDLDQGRIADMDACGVMSAPALRLCMEVVGSERIMFAADYPYESVEQSVQFMDSVDITSSERQAIYATNAERVFRLS